MDEFEELAQIIKALSDPTRLKMLKLLGNTDENLSDDCNKLSGGVRYLCVNALTNHLDVSQSAVSQHLRILRQAGLVRSERRGNFIHYALDFEGIEKYKSVLANTLGDVFVNN